MIYEKQGFYSGQPLKASQLNAMEEGIIEAYELAQTATETAVAANMEKGTGISSTQQLPDKVADGFNFSGKNPNATTLDSTLTDIISYGATGDFASAFGGKCAAQGKRSQAIGTTTIAKGNYSSAEGDNSVALGIASHAEGGATVTNGYGAHSEGSGTQALGDASHAEGYNTTASVDCAHAEGNGTTASAESAHAEGYETIASGVNSHAEGRGTVASGAHSHAEGFETVAEGNSAFAGGNKTYAKGEAAVSLGSQTVAEGYISHAIGDRTRARGTASFTAGCNTVTQYEFQTAVGKFNSCQADTLFEVGGGDGEYNRKNLLSVHTDGKIKADNKVLATEDFVREVAGNAVAANIEQGTGNGSIQQVPDKVADGFMLENNPNAAEFDETLAETIPYGAVGNFSSAFGGKTSAQGKRAHAEGSGTVAKGGNAHSEGSGTVAIGGSAHAEGYATTAAGVASHAEGGTTIAAAQNAHAEGVYTAAVGEHSHAEGEETIASGTASHAEGYKTVAEANYSHAGGYGTKTSRQSQYAIGEYNIGKYDTIFEIGKGVDENSRNNAFEVYANGDVGINHNGEMYSLYKILSDYFVDKNKFGFVSGEYAAKIIVDHMNSVEGSLADFITKKSYKAGTTISFKYYIEDPNYLIRNGTWFKLIRTDDPSKSNIYDTASWFGTVPTDSKGQWLDFSCELPEDGYIYFGGEIGQWGAQYGSANAGRGCIYIDNVTITEDGVSVTDTFTDGLDSSLFNVNNRNAVVLGDGYQK
jgi:autotransporter adhesin